MYIFLNLLIYYDIITLENYFCSIHYRLKLFNLYFIIYASKKVNGGYENTGTTTEDKSL